MSAPGLDAGRLDAIRRGAEQPVAATILTLNAAADDLTAAFVEDPLFCWFMRDDAKRTAARQRFFRVILREAAFPDGTIERPEAGGAAAVWIPSESLGPQPLHRELRALPMLLNATGLGRFGRMMKLRDAMDGNHPMERAHDYLWFLGVHPEAQGAGVGSRLLASKTTRLDAAGRPAFLETATPRNVPLYARHGFETVAEYTPAPGAPLVWAMWREPHAG
jgi:ribosomal protein S18 acetylase RimI-like enzyme